MIKYHVRKKKRTRYTYRFTGLAIFLLCISQVVAFAIGFGSSHRIGTVFAFVFAMYGIFLFFSSFRSSLYNMDFEFNDKDFTVLCKGKTKIYSYDEIKDLSHITPDNELLYSVIHITLAKRDFVLPFSFKKEAADQLYEHLKERISFEVL